MFRLTITRTTWQFGLICLLLLISGKSTATDFRLSVGSYFSTGNYGVDEDILNKDTRIYALPISFQARRWPWTIKLSSNYIWLNSNQVTNAGNTDTDGRSENESDKREETGLGDTLLTLSHGWLFNTSRSLNRKLYSAAWFKIKIPTADDDKDLGSGEFDYEPGITVSHLGEWSPFLKLSFRWRGDSDETNYHHQWKTSIGLSHKTNRRWQASGFLSSREASTNLGQTNTSAYLSIRYQISRTWTVTPYAGCGLSSGSPDYALGWNLLYRFPRAQ